MYVYLWTATTHICISVRLCARLSESASVAYVDLQILVPVTDLSFSFALVCDHIQRALICGMHVSVSILLLDAPK